MMKSPFRKVRGLHKRHRRDLQRSFVQLDELSLASQDMQDMRDCYDSLLSAAASTTNNAYEFSESLQEMGDCLLEKTALTDDEDSGRVLLMLGKAQLEIQKLVDNYRSHISQTITNPSESLLNELRIVEDMKKDCDDKRSEMIIYFFKFLTRLSGWILHPNHMILAASGLAAVFTGVVPSMPLG
ncbi:Arfaptin homology (AH) domain/BAR domain-containing protein [Artemisia annua]|uniref:Arfaptin homology (AH) domain/BAR domain-containing protein n=1 Tax=Artemisia annua TaxID=35608 RepID=A0A2U1NAR1_ARTAN|nr:Arfaptin homology (AH) domain/BAR domain-containing protein [Artemisia annua]